MQEQTFLRAQQHDDDEVDDDVSPIRTYEAWVFLAVLVAMVCCCFCSLVLRRIQLSMDSDAQQTRRRQPVDREDIFRNSLFDLGELDWMCPLCQMVNKPRSLTCSLCGTPLIDAHRDAQAFHKAALQVVARAAPTATPLTARQKRVVRRLMWTRALEVGTVAHAQAHENAVRDGGSVSRETEVEQSLHLAWAPTKPMEVLVLFENVPDPETLSAASSEKRSKSLAGYLPGSPSRMQSGCVSHGSSMHSVASSEDRLPFLQDSPTRTAFGHAAPLPPSPTPVSALMHAIPLPTECPVQPMVAVALASGGFEWSAALADAPPCPPPPAQYQPPPIRLSTQPIDQPDTLLPTSAHPQPTRPSPIHTHSKRLHTLMEELSQDMSVSARDLYNLSLRDLRERHLWFECQLDSLQVPWEAGHITLQVSRKRLLDDSLSSLMKLPKQSLRQFMRVSFQGEVGIDVGGLEREWFILLSKELFSPEAGLFVLSPGATGYRINPGTLFNPSSLSLFEMTGLILGKALMERQSLPIPLATPIYKLLIAAPLDLDDLGHLDPELHRHLSWLLDASPDQLISLDLDFTVVANGKVIELIPGGSSKPVHRGNLNYYLQLQLQWHLVKAVKEPLWHLLSGFFSVVPPTLVQVFDFAELELLLCGTPSIDVDDWRRHTDYMGRFASQGENHPVVQWFWQVLEEMTEEERSRLFQFCTGGSRVPAQGFKALQRNDGRYQRFTLESSDQTGHYAWLPLAHTCFNRLDLPMYNTKEDLLQAVRLVISMEVTGFSID